MIEIHHLFDSTIYFENEMLSIILETMLKYSGILIIIALYFTKLLSIIPMFLIISNKLYSYILHEREREKEKVSIFILSSLLVQSNNKAFLK